MPLRVGPEGFEPPPSCLKGNCATVDTTTPKWISSCVSIEVLSSFYFRKMGFFSNPTHERGALLRAPRSRIGLVSFSTSPRKRTSSNCFEDSHASSTLARQIYKWFRRCSNPRLLGFNRSLYPLSYRTKIVVLLFCLESLL